VGTQDINPGRVTTLATMDIGPWWAIDVAGFAQQYLMIEPVASARPGWSASSAPGLAIRDFYLFVETGDAVIRSGRRDCDPGRWRSVPTSADCRHAPDQHAGQYHVQVKQAPTGAALVSSCT